VSYIYRNATNPDKEAIYGLYREVMKGYISRIWGWNEEWQKNDFSSHFNVDGITLVFKANELVGYSQVEDKGDLLFMRMLAILPGHQGKGIGKKLLESFVKNGNKYYKHLSLEVFKINLQARELYEKHGFSVVSETENSYVMESHA